MRKNFIYPMGIVFVLLLLPYLTFAQSSNIYINSTDQTIRGFGGMNFPRWIGDLTEGQVNTAFGNGYRQIGLSMLRISVPPNSNEWSRELATAQRAKNLGAIVFATPWSPPASMKSNGSTTGGSLNSSSYSAYANHLRDFTNYMSSNGASLYAISVQNEPDYVPNYESCGWTASQMRTFLNNNASVIPTRVIGPETINPKSSWYNTLSSASQLDIYADHLYGGSPTRFNGKEHWMTEHYTPNSNSNSANNWPEALEVGREIHNCMTNGYNAYVWWYIRRSYGLITEDGNISKRGFVMSHYSKFVRPGYVRVRADDSPTSGVRVSSYKNGNTIVIVAINQNSSSRSVTFNFSGNNVTNITKWETTSGRDVYEAGTYSGGSSLANTLAGNSITTFRGTIGGPDGGGGPGSYVQLHNRGTGLILDGMGRTSNGAACGQYAGTNHQNSHWEMVDVGSGYVQFHNRGTGMILDGMGRTDNGSDVGQWAGTSHQNSHWSVQQYDGNYYRIQNRATGLYLDGMGRTNNGANCGQYAGTTHVNAQWQLVNISGRIAESDSERQPEAEIKKPEFALFPNPASSILYLNLPEGLKSGDAQILDFSGRIMKEADLSATKPEIDIRSLNAGSYIIKIRKDDNVITGKFIKAH